MLRGISPLLTPDMLHAIASMGHGDSIAIVDANFPAAKFAHRLIILQESPLAIERHAFYRAAKAAFVVLQTGERRLYGNIPLRKGVIPPEAD